jgi:hypothetical protein
MIPVLFQRQEEVPRFGIRLAAIAVLVLMDRIDRGHELLFRAVLLPEVKGRPLLNWRDRAVDLFQLQVKEITELPERIVYVYYSILGHNIPGDVVATNDSNENHVQRSGFKVQGSGGILKHDFCT